MVRHHQLALLTLLVLGLTLAVPSHAFATSTTPTVDRVFYFSTSRTLSPVQPTTGTGQNATFSGSPLEFKLQTPLLDSVTIAGPTTFSLSLVSNRTSKVDVLVTPTVREKFLGTPSSINFTSPTPFTYALLPGLNHKNFTYDIHQPLGLYSQISAGVNVTFPSKTNVTLLWGPSPVLSFVVLPLSGYMSLQPTAPVVILDRSQTPTSSFNLNASVGNNVVIFQANAFSAFGPSDIDRVNLTVVDPNLRPVKQATNLAMTPFPPPTSQPYAYTTTWVYPSNATVGVYQIYIDVYDVQNGHAYSFRGPASFTLHPPGLYLPPPFDLLPYGAIAGVGAVGGVLFYRRRKAKSYLAPFEHFNSLTGGELDGGTLVAVEGNTGAGKTLLSEQLMYEDLKRGIPCVFVATGDFPANVRANMKSMGLDVAGYEQNGLLTFVDGYSPEAGQESREKFSIPSLGDLTTLGMKITSSLPSGFGKGASLYFDSLMPIAAKAKPESIVSFVQSVGARMRGLGGKAFFTLGASVDGRVQRQLEEMADCVVQMEAFEEQGVRKRRLRIAKFRARRHQEGWAIFGIETGRGIIFYSKRPSK